jgi:hypothetical protein
MNAIQTILVPDRFLGMGTLDRSRLNNLMVSGTTEEVVRRAPRPVRVVKSQTKSRVQLPRLVAKAKSGSPRSS